MKKERKKKEPSSTASPGTLTELDRWEVGQLGLQLAPIEDGGFAGGGFTHYTKTAAPVQSFTEGHLDKKED